MALEPGTTLGPYRVTAKIGEGGMGAAADPWKPVASAIDPLTGGQCTVTRHVQNQRAPVRRPKEPSLATSSDADVTTVWSAPSSARTENRFLATLRNGTPDAMPFEDGVFLKRPRFRRVLVVEDDPCTRDWLCRTFCRRYQVSAVGVEDNDSALDVLRHERIDLIVQDLFRPHGNGFDLSATLRASPSLSGIPVIVVSGQGARYDRHALDFGAIAVLQKPVSRDALTDAADLVASKNSNGLL